MKRKKLKLLPINMPLRSRVFWLRLIVSLCSLCCVTTGHAQQSFKLAVSEDITHSKRGFGFREIELSTSNGAPAAKDLTVWCHVYSENDWGNSGPRR